MAGCRQRIGMGLAVVATTTVSLPSRAQLVERFSVDQSGDFALIGNTLARDCSTDPADLLAGTVGNCGENDEDSGADVLWSVAPDGSNAVANISIAPDEAASIAVLELPEGSSVTHAALYWSAQTGQGDATGATFGRGDAAASVSAARVSRSGADGVDYYQSVADVTELVRGLGAGAYRVSRVDAADPVGQDDTTYYAGWWLVVFYAHEGDPVRHLALYDGFGFVTDLAPSSATLTGFEVPLERADAKLGVVAFDGDATSDGDQLRFGPSAPLGAAARLEDSNNFFDSSRREAGQPFGAAGDRPRATGDAGSMSGVDLHVVDVGATLEPGQTTAELLATTTADRFFLSGVALSIATTTPDLSPSSLSMNDLGGPPLRPGDEIEYSIVVDNAGSGAAPVVTLRAPLPPQVSYVPGSLAIADGPGAGALTDAADDDAGELELAASPTLVVRIGSGSDGTQGGRLEAGESSLVSFRVRLDVGASGSIVSQAQIGVASAPGADPTFSLTDANLDLRGPNPTELAIDDCASSADCDAGVCDLEQSPSRCVACLSDVDCPGLTPSCDDGLGCVCVPAAEETLCDGRDDDCDGAIDEGLAG
ncbi:MAG TPA: hypothetical protein VMG12_17210, partial [Polyangiaceae bacterium]|nr:hypothetical protein [Polyangiaceae bacterium]